ncbi:hypothetical protein [Haladaptatus cibarius]|uniref:hypothetical protein n=1 Tax=Haladaptatus cibarius TaxID=453847 RepID=UPI0006799CD5|nr:hypothetical protein [Haladaptatus cibarius]
MSASNAFETQIEEADKPSTEDSFATGETADEREKLVERLDSSVSELASGGYCVRTNHPGQMEHLLNRDDSKLISITVINHFDCKERVSDIERYERQFEDCPIVEVGVWLPEYPKTLGGN